MSSARARKLLSTKNFVSMTGTVAKIKEEWVKLVIVGDGTCGKTCMLHVFKVTIFLMFFLNQFFISEADFSNFSVN